MAEKLQKNIFGDRGCVAEYNTGNFEKMYVVFHVQKISSNLGGKVHGTWRKQILKQNSDWENRNAH